MLIAVFPLVLVIIGALLYAICSETTAKAKLADLGRVTFACGLLALAFALAAHVVRIG